MEVVRMNLKKKSTLSDEDTEEILKKIMCTINGFQLAITELPFRESVAEVTSVFLLPVERQ